MVYYWSRDGYNEILYIHINEILYIHINDILYLHINSLNPWAHFTNGSWAHNWNLLKDIFNSYFNITIRWQFCTCHNSRAIVACAKLWPDLIIILQVLATQIFIMFRLWTQKSFMKWVSWYISYTVLAGGSCKSHIEMFSHFRWVHQPDFLWHCRFKDGNLNMLCSVNVCHT